VPGKEKEAKRRKRRLLGKTRFDIFLRLWYIKGMDYALEERIGNPDLFTGRKEELDYFLKWINDKKIHEHRHPGPAQNGENRHHGTVVQYYVFQKRRGDSFLL
jgi:hypothetical protein